MLIVLKNACISGSLFSSFCSSHPHLVVMLYPEIQFYYKRNKTLFTNLMLSTPVLCPSFVHMHHRPSDGISGVRLNWSNSKDNRGRCTRRTQTAAWGRFGVVHRSCTSQSSPAIKLLISKGNIKKLPTSFPFRAC